MVTVRELDPTTWINCALIIAETILVSSTVTALATIADPQMASLLMLLSLAVYCASGLGLLVSLNFIYVITREKSVSRGTFDLLIGITATSLLLLIVQAFVFWVLLI